MKSAVNILRTSYPDLVDEIERRSNEEGIHTTQFAARELRKLFGLPNVKNSSVEKPNIQNRNAGCQQKSFKGD